ncbi:Aliphatic amidase expression-regulating protein [Hartmannibacter diazotrophicus]|uniref:Aliphatic amidase expression-regulating protein n=1 Tax=Hartmannibacter diazotrophicus TaxID=1482074 RepID=A0A2C9D5W3_9HYPH|nr:transporter substrate-binding domain-containing protein [Hartmannibacter diazotrophicus]SON55722.1 Aliphatic amidase expression-regulating protein [Hartmannibacter diazotrophicus]
MEPWRIGILFSRSGAMEVTESEHFFGTALAIEEINGSGGILGRSVEPVCYDPASEPGLYRKLAERLLGEDGVDVIFGCSTSASRKAVLPVIERRNGLLWYPSLYEGFEYSPNIIYTGAAPNQNSVQLAAYLLQEYGSTIYLIGSDYIYPRETNRLMREFVESQGGEIVGEVYVPIGSDTNPFPRIIDDIRRAAPKVIFSTVVGHDAQAFYRLYSDAGFDPRRQPIASLTMAEGEIQVIGPERCVGHITAGSYFGTVKSDVSRGYVSRYRARYGADAPVSMWSEVAYSQAHLFAAALERAGTLDTQRLTEAALGLDWQAPGGRMLIEPENHHTWLTPRIGRVRADGEFDIVWEAKGPVRPDPYLTCSAPAGNAWLSS